MSAAAAGVGLVIDFRVGVLRQRVGWIGRSGWGRCCVGVSRSRAYIPARESTGGINRRGSCTVDPVLG